MSEHATKPWAGWHLIYNTDGTFRGYEPAEFDANGEMLPSKVYAQEGRNADGSPRSGAADAPPS